MGKPELSSVIMGQMDKWGGDFQSNAGCDHNSVADKKDSVITSKEQTLNIGTKMDASHAKPNSMNPGVDKSFLAKASPLMDTTGHGKLSRSLKD